MFIKIIVKNQIPRTSEGKVPYFNDEICKLRYIEYMHKVETDNPRFLVAIFTAYDSNIERFPLRVFQLLQLRNLLSRSSVFMQEQIGPITRPYSNIEADRSITVALSNSSPPGQSHPRANGVMVSQCSPPNNVNKKREAQTNPGSSPKKVRTTSSLVII